MPNENLDGIIDIIFKAVDKLPDPPREKLKKELVKIKELVMDARPPKIMIVGRRGAGKSSLINAFFREKVAAVGSVLSETGEAEWHEFKNSKGSIKILDTRGIGDKTKPKSSNFKNSIDEIKNAINEDCPDILLFLCKAKEVDAHISEDLKNILEIRDYISDNHNYEIPVISLITQVDELDPKRVMPPYNDEIKQKNINQAIDAINNIFTDKKIDLINSIPICAYAQYENGKLISDEFWNIDTVLELLIEKLPNNAQLALARISALNSVQTKFSRILIGSTATVCAGIATVPIPIADLIPITSAQIAMITGIAYISGRELSKDSAKEFLVALGANVGVGFALREGARALVKFVFPGAGSVISAGIAFAATWGIGESAITYFIDKKSIEETKLRFNDAKDEHKYKE